MKTHLLFLLPIMLLLIGCGKDDPTPEPEPAEPEFTSCKILESKSSASGPSGVTNTYHYDAQERIIKMERVNVFGTSTTKSTWEYEYDGSGKVTKIIMSSPAQNSSTRLLYDYNSTGQVEQLHVSNKYGEGEYTLSTSTVFEYASPQELKEMRVYDVSIGIEKLTKTEKYFYENGLMNRVESQSYQGKKVITIEYDDKKRPDLYGILRVYMLDHGYPFKHNIVKYITTDAEGQVIRAESYEATFTYNPQDYPTSVAYNQMDNSKYGYVNTFGCK